MFVFVRRFGLGLGAVVAIAVATAPLSGAGVKTLSVSAGGWHGYGQDCRYQLVATTDPETEGAVVFTDNGKNIPGSPVYPNYQLSKATIEWTPTTIGRHTLVAVQRIPFGQAEVDVFVRPNYPLSACL